MLQNRKYSHIWRNIKFSPKAKTEDYSLIKFKNLVVAHSLGGRVGVGGGYGEGGVGRREIMCGCGLRKEREWWWL